MIKHGAYEIEQCHNGDIKIKYKGEDIVWIDNHYMNPENVPPGGEKMVGLPHVIINAVNQDEASVCLSIGDDKVLVNDIDWEKTGDNRNRRIS